MPVIAVDHEIYTGMTSFIVNDDITGLCESMVNRQSDYMGYRWMGPQPTAQIPMSKLILKKHLKYLCTNYVLDRATSPWM